MNIRILKLNAEDRKHLSAIPPAEAMVTWEVPDHGASKVNVVIRAFDSFGHGYVVASLWGSTTEMRDVAGRMIDAANRADAEAPLPKGNFVPKEEG